MIFGAYTLFIFTFVAMVFIVIAKAVLRKLGVDVKDIKDDDNGRFNIDITDITDTEWTHRD